MLAGMLANGELLPETFHFLEVGWWVVHLVAIPVVFIVGFLVGKRAGARPAAQKPPG